MPRKVAGAEVPRLQLRRGRAGHLQGPRHPALQPALADRGHGDRRLRDGRDRRLQLHPRRVPRRARTSASRKRSRKRTRPGCSARTSSARGFDFDLLHRPRLRAPTSAARKPRCSSRSKARRASRASSRRSRRASACTASRPRSTTPRPSPRCRGSSATAAEWFLELGKPNNGGTKIFSVSGHVERPGNYEVPLGTPFAEAARAGRRHARRPQAQGGDPRRLVGAGAAGRRS